MTHGCTILPCWTASRTKSTFFSQVKEVKDCGNGRSHWTVAGPAGVPVEWGAVISAHLPNEVRAWRSESNSLIQHAEIVRFQPNAEGGPPSTCGCRITRGSKRWGMPLRPC
jgi:uncharacterized membrane protein